MRNTARPDFGFFRNSAYVFLLVGLILSSIGCATSSQNLRLEARKNVISGNYEDAEKLLLKKEILAEAKDRVLSLLELGTVANLSGQFEKSNRLLFAAKEMVEQLHTQSISEGVTTWVLNDLSATYRGLDYERSLIHYYLVLNFIGLSQAKGIPAWELPELKVAGKLVLNAEAHQERKLSDKDRRQYLMQARAEVLAWDTTLETIRNKSRGSPVYKDDLLAKLLGARVHQMFGTTTDLNTAKVLYEDAKMVMQRAYNLYPTFNQKYRDFEKDYAQLPNLSEDELKGRYIASTDASTGVQSLVSSMAQGGETSANPESMFVLELGLIAPKKEKVYTIGLSSLFGQIQDPKTRALVEEIGARVLLQFAPMVGVGMVSVAVVGAAASSSDAPEERPQHLSSAIDKAIGFEFRLPEIPRVQTPIPERLRLSPVQGGAPIELPLAVVNPIGDFAAQEVDIASGAIAAKTGVRVGLKYLSALLAAYATFKALEKQSEFLAKISAVGAFMGAKAAIDASEAADIRAWTLLPQVVAAANGAVPSGEYDVSLVGEGYSEGPLWRATVAEKQRQIFKWRLNRLPASKTKRKLAASDPLP
jgi:hypothetical protein